VAGKSSRAVTRTRATTAEVSQRVDAIAATMRSGLWVPGESGKILAKDWGLPLTTIEHHAAEAWRRVCAEADDAAKARPTIAGTLATSLSQAAAAHEYKAVASLADVWSKVVGARAPERHEHAVVVAQYEALPPAGKAAWLRERAAAMIAEADRLEAEDACLRQ